VQEVGARGDPAGKHLVFAGRHAASFRCTDPVSSFSKGAAISDLVLGVPFDIIGREMRS